MLKKSFNEAWIFRKKGEEDKRRVIDLPHDAMIEEERIPKLIAGDTSGFFPGGYYIYEKELNSADIDLKKAHILSFDGVYQKAMVFLNDEEIGNQIYGYTNFQVDLTDKLIDGKNVIRVEVDNTQVPNSRWYTGSGIYRDVTLYTGERKHILPYGIKVDTLSIDPAVLQVSVATNANSNTGDSVFKDNIGDNGAADISLTIKGPDQSKVPYDILDKNYDDGKFTLKIQVDHAQCWSEKSPCLYECEAVLSSDGFSDEASVSFGIRKLAWNPKDGFMINREPVKLRGACIHHDNGILGAKEYTDVALRKVKILKESGYNAIRTAHNEPSEAILSACDKLGMYVMAEFSDVWRGTKNQYDYSLYFDNCAVKDIGQMVKKCATHPSVVMYSVGNEVYDTKSAECAQTCKILVDAIKEEDATRPVTLGFNILGATSAPKDKPITVDETKSAEEVDPKRIGKASPLISSKLMNTVSMYLPKLMKRVKPEQLEQNFKMLLDTLDFAGLNYGTHLFTLNNVNNNRMVVNTETFPAQIGHTWHDTISHSWVVGDFMWTGWDHLGECGLGVVEYGKVPTRLNKPYPCISSGIGSVNLVGEIEAQGYYTKAVYGLLDKPYIGVRPVNHTGEKVRMSNWRGTDVVNSYAWGEENYGKVATVEVFSSDPYVELFQNGITLGRQKTIESKANYVLQYKRGEIEAISYDSFGNETGRSKLVSDDNETKLNVYAESSELVSGSVAYIFAEIVDSKGTRKVYKADNIRFEVSGCGKLIATGSGNPCTTLAYTGNVANTWYGSTAAVIQAGDESGTICVKAYAGDTLQATLEIPVIVR